MTETNSPTNRLKPVQVPWQVSPSTPEAEMFLSEVNPPNIKFGGLVVILNSEYENQSTSPMPIKSDCSEAYHKSIVDCMITCVFQGVCFVQHHPIENESHKLYLDYDDSLIPKHLRLWELVYDLAKWQEEREQFKCEWITEGTCPNPGVYQVLHSTWANNMRKKLDNLKTKESELSHYLFPMREVIFEILTAKPFTWTTDVWLQSPEET